MKVIGYPRIHVGLADMGFASPRSFGGIGFAIEHSPTMIDFSFRDDFAIEGTKGLDQAGKRDLHHILDHLSGIRGARPFHASIVSHALQHQGFGSKTSLALSLITGANELCRLGLTRNQMQKLSGRGGASGVGIHSFFEGGVICDGGHRAASPDRGLSPSSARAAGEVPPRLARLEFPSEWLVILLLGTAPVLSGDDEVDFFRKNAPVERHEALETIACLYHGVLPAFALKDDRSLAISLAYLHARGFKMRELERCDDATRRCFKALSDQGFPVGLSSVGPLLYVIVRKGDQDAANCVLAAASAARVELLATAAGWNSGYQITDADAQ
jgi:beta-ribofuranosylaminobenzene 5'-phosphate synthase